MSRGDAASVDHAPEPRSREERAAAGKAARARVPREAHAELGPADGRDPVGLLLRQATTRVPDLVPIRHGRMLVSPFTFYRGGALIMAVDLATTQTSGLRTQLCGDAHLSNFGAYGSPERRLVFDISDFDETLPGPFEWDVKRLAASLVVAGRGNGFSVKECREVTTGAVASYRTAMRTFARQSTLSVWYARLDVDDFVRGHVDTTGRRRTADADDLRAAKAAMAKARTRDGMQALRKLTRLVDGRLRIVSDPPLIVPVTEMTGLDTDQALARLRVLLTEYRDSLQPDRRHLLDRFRVVDVAHKVVGVGSVGTRAWVLLLDTGTDGDVLLLQAKQAERSVLADGAGDADVVHQGERVVDGQRLMQATSDIFLGWVRSRPTDGPGDDYYVRQLRDWKFSADVDHMAPTTMRLYAELCGWTLARAHARSGDRIAIAAYLGKSSAFDHAVADFAESYADRNERDHAALADAVRSGRVTAVSGV